MGVVRWQERREGQPFAPVTGEAVKTKKAIVLREIYENYNVIPNN